MPSNQYKHYAATGFLSAFVDLLNLITQMREKKPPLSIQQQERVSVSYSVSRLSCRGLLCSAQPITLRTTCRQVGMSFSNSEYSEAL